MQMSLHHETITDALREVVAAAVGPKAIGARMFPDMAPDHAAGKVRDCLNTDRRERFTPDQVCMLLRIGREVGCHAGIVFMSRDAGYSDPVPVEPEDEITRLQREYVEATKALLTMAGKIEALGAKTTLRRAA